MRWVPRLDPLWTSGRKIDDKFHDVGKGQLREWGMVQWLVSELQWLIRVVRHGRNMLLHPYRWVLALLVNDR